MLSKAASKVNLKTYMTLTNFARICRHAHCAKWGLLVYCDEPPLVVEWKWFLTLHFTKDDKVKFSTYLYLQNFAGIFLFLLFGYCYSLDLWNFCQNSIFLFRFSLTEDSNPISFPSPNNILNLIFLPCKGPRDLFSSGLSGEYFKANG